MTIKRQNILLFCTIKKIIPVEYSLNKTSQNTYFAKITLNCGYLTEKCG